VAPPKFFRSLSESPTQTIDSSPCCKTGPSSSPPKWKCLAPPLPVEYILTINNLEMSDYEKALNKSLHLHKSTKETKFLLSVSHQVGLRPGIHRSIPVLCNNISATRFLFNIYLNQRLTNVSVGCKSYIGLFPSYFSTRLSLKSEAPVQLSLTLTSASMSWRRWTHHVIMPRTVKSFK